MEVIEVRDYCASTDQAFIYSTWLRNYKYSSYFAKRIKPVIFFAGHHTLVAHLIAKPTVKVMIAHPKGDPETILGYLAYEPKEYGIIVHFTFVKEAFRKMGVAKALFKKQDIDINKISFTHWTLPMDEIIKKYPEITYNPYEL